MPQLSTGFPNGPFVDPTGEVTDVWRRYLLTLDARTGGRLGTDTTALQAEIDAETAARAAGDTALTAAIADEATLRIAGDANEAALRAQRDNELAIQINQASSAAIPFSALQAQIDALQAEIDALEAAAGTGGDIYAPLCTGDVPPLLVGTMDGQAIMAQIG